MAVKSKEDILSAIRDKFSNDNSDETIALIEDVSDTLADLEQKARGDGTDWQAEAKRIDNEWREKYKARFFSGKSNDDEVESLPDNDDEPQIKTFEELFTKE